MKKPTTQRQDPDADLLARVAVFWPLYEDHERKAETAHTCFEKMQDLPGFPGFGKSESDEFEQCAQRSGYHPAWEI